MYHYIVNVPGICGYSFMVASIDDLNENEVLDLSLSNGLFEDDYDVRHASVDCFVCNSDIEHFESIGCLFEI